MTEKYNSSPGNNPSSLHLFLFSVGGACIGVDADQVSSIEAYDSDDNSLTWFHEIMNYGVRTVDYIRPAVITLKTASCLPRRLIVDSIEEITEIALEEIYPFPELLEPYLLTYGLWGILIRRNRMIFIMDFNLAASHNKTDDKIILDIEEACA